MAAKSGKSTRRRRSAPAARERASNATRMLNAFSIGALAIGAAVLYGGIRRLARTGNAEHPAPDLALDAPRPGSDGERAPVDFRPDPTAPVPAAERDALRPALAGAAAPTLVAGQADELRRLDAAPA